MQCASPQGVKLLSYLYNEAQNNCSNENYPVLLSLLKSSCEPYTRSVTLCSSWRELSSKPRIWFYFIDMQYLLYWSLLRPLSGLILTVLTLLHLDLCQTGSIVACFETFMGNSWSRSMRSISVSEVRWHAHTLVLSHKHTGFSYQDLKMKSLPDRQEKNRFYYGLYCLVGFVLVSITDVMMLLDDNQGETESAATAVGTRAISAQ